MDEGYELPSDSEDEFCKKQQVVAQNLITCDASALGLIEGAVADEIFPQIANQETVKATWDVLKQEWKGDFQVMIVKRQDIRRDFEYARMRNGEVLSDYLTRFLD